jgi:hypothetical protein
VYLATVSVERGLPVVWNHLQYFNVIEYMCMTWHRKLHHWK